MWKVINIQNIFVPKSQRFRYGTTELFPGSKIKVFKPNPKKEIFPKKPNRRYLLKDKRNLFGIQMLPDKIYEQVFTAKKEAQLAGKIESCRRELQKHGMQSTNDVLKDVEFSLPPLKGKNIEEHFQIIGEEQVQPYRDLVLDLIKGIPKPPIEWQLREGWTRYVPGEEPEEVPYPLEQALIFDVEVCMSAGKAPTLATAVSNVAWYGWVSSTLIDGDCKPVTSHQYNINSLIPLESLPKDKATILNQTMLKPKIIIGHNVSYDRARIKEQYWIKKTGTRFLDTMSMHICVSGLTSYQRALLKSNKLLPEDDCWKTQGSLNNLVDVYKLYYDKNLNKDTRDLFVQGTIGEIKNEFQNVMKYCCGDTKATHEILQKLFPVFLERFPHPVTLAGMLELGSAYLPINDRWNRYVSESEQAYDDLESEGKITLAKRADQACQLLHFDKYKEDIWMWDQDWEVKNLKLKKPTIKQKQLIEVNVENLSKEENRDIHIKIIENDNGNDEEIDPLKEKFQYLWDTREFLSAVKTLLPGYPNWYRKLCSKPGSEPEWIPGPHLIGTSMQITPKLLSLTWEGYPLHYIRGKGWGFVVPFTDEDDVGGKFPLKQLLEKCPILTKKPKSSSGAETLSHIANETDNYLMRKEYYFKVKADKTDGIYKGTGIWTGMEIENSCWFFKLPHKDGASNNVGNPLARDFLNKFSENVLAGDTESAEQVLTIARMLSYWRNNRDRIMSQMVVWLNERDLPTHLQESDYTYGAILPQVVVCGTLTRRAMEPTWMTASNAQSERIGSELRAMVQAPPGYYIVGADVDSQELWIASVLGDASHAKMHGATPFGWMTLSGNKADGTDMHSVTAKAVGISRDNAKVINYARIYGAGQNFAERLLKQFNPSMSEQESRSKALKMFTLTKGKRLYYIKDDYKSDLEDRPYAKWEAHTLARKFGKSAGEMFSAAKWVDGTESAMFNRLEEIANSEEPRTPFLGCRLSRALESVDEDRFLPTRINWVVQSGAVDFLHLMLVCMRWILGDNVRFCLSFHDEIRYLVPEELKYTTALAMHVTNLLTRSFCAYRLGLNDLPYSVAFFSSVEIDTVLRKESKDDCKTPSNPHGLLKGYGIPNGESLDIYSAIEKANGNSENWYKIKR